MSAKHNIIFGVLVIIFGMVILMEEVVLGKIPPWHVFQISFGAGLILQGLFRIARRNDK